MNRIKFTAALIVALFIGSTTPAYAADDDSEFDKNVQLITTIGILTVTSTTVYFLQGLSDRILDKMFAQVATYMRENAVALQQDISLGAGPAIDDLATLYAVEPHAIPQLAARLKAHRHELVLILSHAEQIDAADAARMTQIALAN